jgi:hypothetical protein
MRALSFSFGLLGLLLLGPLSAHGAHDVVEEAQAGFVLTEEPVPPPILPAGPFGFPVFGLVRTLAGGDALTFDGLTVRRVTPGGAVRVLGTLPQAAFPGCFALAPDESVALVGESLSGGLYRVALDGSGMSPLGTLTNNFDAAFVDATTALVSANATGSFSDNHIVRVDVTSGAQTDLCFVSGPSGPLARDPLGNLYYGLQGPEQEVIVWTAAELAGGSLLSEADATPISSGWQGISSLAVDPVHGGLFLAENDFLTGERGIYRTSATKALSELLVSGAAAAPAPYISGLEFSAAPCGAVFAGYQPACGGTLRYGVVDFTSFAQSVALAPARPTGALTGPGTSGAGLVTFEVSGAPALGFAQVFFAPTPALSAPETAYLFPGALPLFTGFALEAIEVLGAPLPLDGSGSASLSVYHPGGLLGLLSVQAMCIDPGGLIVGTSSVAHL